MMTSTRSRLVPLCGLALLAAGLLTLSGCGSTSAATGTAPEPDQAQAVLRQALDAWKSGAAHNALAGQSPAIRMADEEWLAGGKLIDFRLADPGQPVGPRVPCPAVLTVRDARGRSSQRTVLYQVSLAPTPMIVRQD